MEPTELEPAFQEEKNRARVRKHESGSKQLKLIYFACCSNGNPHRESLME
jgi:hypothetical protein